MTAVFPTDAHFQSARTTERAKLSVRENRRLPQDSIVLRSIMGRLLLARASCGDLALLHIRWARPRATARTRLERHVDGDGNVRWMHVHGKNDVRLEAHVAPRTVSAVRVALQRRFGGGLGFPTILDNVARTLEARSRSDTKKTKNIRNI